MEEQNYYNTQILYDKIQIKCSDLNNNINTKIYSILKKKIENKCYKNGFIVKDSIKLINKNLGILINHDSENFVEYKIKYSVTIIQPTIDDKIICYINDINKLGIIAYIKYKDIKDMDDNNGISDSPLLIIIPNENIPDIEKYDINHKIKIIVKATRIQFNANKIQIIGEIAE